MSDSAMVAVTGSTVPYIFDLPHILSLPSGFEARFRYFVDWVDPTVRERVDADAKGTAYAGEELLLVYHSLETGQLLPVRKAEILEVRRYGPMYYLRFAVSDFPPLRPELVTGRDRAPVRKEEREWLHDIGLRAVGIGDQEAASELPKGMYLRPSGLTWTQAVSRTDCLPEAQPDRRWAALAALLLDEPALRGVPLFFIEGLLDRKGKILTPCKMKNYFSKGGKSGAGYKAVQHVRYRLRVLQWRRSQSGQGVPERNDAPRAAGADNPTRCGDAVPDEPRGNPTERPNPDSSDRHRALHPRSITVEGESGVQALTATPAPVEDERNNEGGTARFRVGCRVDPDTIALEGQSDLVVGKYDVLEYSLKAIGRGYGELSLAVEESDTQSQHYHSWPHVYGVRVPLQVRRNGARVLIACTLFLSGVGFYSVTKVHAVSGWLSGAGTTLVQLLGLGLVYVVSADFLSGYVKFAGQSRSLVSSGKPQGES